MSVDKLQEKIRKLKNPTVVDFNILPENIPPHILETADSFNNAFEQYSKELLDALKNIVPAVRFSFDTFALLGSSGLKTLQELLSYAKEQSYFVFLDGTEPMSAQSAERMSEILLADNCYWYFDALIITSYIGSDGIRPYVEKLKEKEKSLFVVVRTANKSAPETQDLLTGSRLMHVAKVDMINRYADSLIGRSGYSQVAVMASASTADSLRTLRTKYKYLFLLLDGCDYPNANAKNCSFAFDNLGHGAIACANQSIIGAWQEAEQDKDYILSAVHAAERLKKNLTRYITIF